MAKKKNDPTKIRVNPYSTAPPVSPVYNASDYDPVSLQEALMNSLDYGEAGSYSTPIMVEPADAVNDYNAYIEQLNRELLMEAKRDKIITNDYNNIGRFESEPPTPGGAVNSSRHNYTPNMGGISSFVGRPMTTTEREYNDYMVPTFNTGTISARKSPKPGSGNSATKLAAYKTYFDRATQSWKTSNMNTAVPSFEEGIGADVNGSFPVPASVLAQFGDHNAVLNNFKRTRSDGTEAIGMYALYEELNDKGLYTRIAPYVKMGQSGFYELAESAYETRMNNGSKEFLVQVPVTYTDQNGDTKQSIESVWVPNYNPSDPTHINNPAKVKAGNEHIEKVLKSRNIVTNATALGNMSTTFNAVFINTTKNEIKKALTNSSGMFATHAMVERFGGSHLHFDDFKNKSEAINHYVDNFANQYLVFMLRNFLWTR